MPLQSYNTNVLSTDRNAVILTTKFTVNAATCVVTLLEGKRLSVVEGNSGTVAAPVGTGTFTITLPQIFRNVVSIQSYVIDTALAGLQLIPTSDVTVVNKTQSQFTATLTKLVSGAPAAVTTGTYTIGIEVVAAA